MQQATIKIALNTRGKRLLAEHGFLAVRLVITARAYGTARALHGTATVKLVAPRPRVVDTGHAGFGVGSSALTPALRAWVRTVAKRIKGYRTATLTGFTSYGGPRAYLPNLALGRARAQAVATALRAGGYRGTLVVRSEGPVALGGVERDSSGPRGQPPGGAGGETLTPCGRRVALRVTATSASTRWVWYPSPYLFRFQQEGSGIRNPRLQGDRERAREDSNL
ncbi:MAG: hypothetical protein JWN65_2195 [Solirubrobacterales bacterium]|nr:hypothetical protein [Solirubrobacterales bacterium]